ncbi:MAG TPA: ABC transporter ATP-binding protein [Anaeromyxobacter sp.]
MTDLLAVDHVSRRFGGLSAVRDVSFGIPRGQLVGLVGPNGAGKTTLFNVLVGLYAPSAGVVRLEGRTVSRLPPHRVCALGLTKTFQNVALFFDMTVRDNVLVGGLMRHSLRDARDLASHTLERVGLASVADKLAADLTFPERARVELARALCTEPKVLLLDEVMAALTHVEMDEILALIRQLREDGLTVLVVEHHMRAIMSLCERILVLNFGELIADGTPSEIVHDERVITAYLGRGHGSASARHA